MALRGIIGSVLVLGVGATPGLAYQSAAAQAVPHLRRSEQWTRFHFSLDNSAFNPYEERIDPVSLSRLQLMWTFDANTAAFGSPIVARERVFVGTANGFFYILEDATGDVIRVLDLGQNSYQSGASAAGAIDGHMLFVPGAQGSLLAYDYLLETIVWFAPPPAAHVAGIASPAVFDGNVYHAVCNGEKPTQCPVGRIRCYDEFSGALRWSTDMVPPGYTGGGVWSTFAIDTTRRLVIAATGNPDNGNPNCGVPIPCNTPGDHTDSIVALNADTGAVVWSFQAITCDDQDRDFGYSSVVLFNDGTRDLAGAGSKNGYYYAVDRNNGLLAWSVNLNHGRMWAAAASAYGKLFMNPGDDSPGVSVALDAGNGSVIWSQTNPERNIGGPAVANGLVFTGIGQSIAALDQRSGKIMWSYDMGSPIYSNPAVVNGCLYVASRDGLIRKFALAD